MESAMLIVVDISLKTSEQVASGAIETKTKCKATNSSSDYAHYKAIS